MEQLGARLIQARPRSRPETAACVLALALMFLGLSNTFLWPHAGALKVPHGFYWAALAPYARVMTSLTWITAAVLLAWSLARSSALGLGRALAIFAPLLAAAALSTLLSDAIGRSALYSLSWFLILGSGAAVGLIMGYRPVLIALLLIALATLIACGLVHLQAPLIAWPPTAPQKLGIQFQGVFLGKQVCGWIMATFFIVATCAHRAGPLWLRLPIAGAALLVLCLSDSRMSLACALLSAAVYGVALPAIRRANSLPRGAMVVGLIGCAGVAAALGLVFVSPAAAIAGRDGNLGVRREIWKAYSSATVGHETFGLGPGAFAPEERFSKALFADHLPPLAHYKTSRPSWWQSPHSLYLNYFGETGWLGVGALVAALAYLALVRPALARSSAAMVAGGLALQLLVGGLVEPSDGAYPGHIQLSLFLIVLFHAVAIDRQGGAAAWLSKAASAEKRHRPSV